MVKAKNQVSIELEPEMAGRLEQLEQAEGRSTQEIVQAAIARYLEEREGRGEAIARALKFKQDRLGVPQEDMEAWVDSWDTDEELPCPEPKPV